MIWRCMGIKSIKRKDQVPAQFAAPGPDDPDPDDLDALDQTIDEVAGDMQGVGMGGLKAKGLPRLSARE